MKKIFSFLLGALLVLSITMSASSGDYPGKEQERQNIENIYKEYMSANQAKMAADMSMEIQDYIGDDTDIKNYFDFLTFQKMVLPGIITIAEKYMDKGLALQSFDYKLQANDETCNVRVSLTFNYPTIPNGANHNYYPFYIKGMEPDCSIYKSPETEL